jgi:hypothetical protein
MGSPAAGRVDLLTVLEHELGHVIGLPDDAKAGDLMNITLGIGVRRDPSTSEVATAGHGAGSAIPTTPSALDSNGPVSTIPAIQIGKKSHRLSPEKGEAYRLYHELSKATVAPWPRSSCRSRSRMGEGIDYRSGAECSASIRRTSAMTSG